jgi:replicative DNA helicase
MPDNKYLIDAEIGDIETAAEENLLGAIMLGTVCFGDTALLKEVSALISPSDFRDFPHQGDLSRYYAAMVGCDRADVISVTHQLLNTGAFKPGDPERLSNLLLMHYDTSSYNYMDFARIVKDYANKRRGDVNDGTVDMGNIKP